MNKLKILFKKYKPEIVLSMFALIAYLIRPFSTLISDLIIWAMTITFVGVYGTLGVLMFLLVNDIEKGEL